MVYRTTEHERAPFTDAFPGVPWWRMDIAPVGEAPELNPLDTVWLTSLARLANGFFDARARQMTPGQSGEFFTIHTSSLDAHTFVHKAAEAIQFETAGIANAHLALFPAGSIPIAKILFDMGYPAHRMHIVDISGSKGTESGSSSINSVIPDALLNPANQIIIPEDIIDSADSIFTFIKTRGVARDNNVKHVIWLQNLEKRLKAAHANGNHDLAAYADFARAASDEHVSVLAVWSKNTQALNALVTRAFVPEANIQQNLLMSFPIIRLPSHLWVLGGDYTMDTGVLWSRIVEHLPKELRHDPRVTMYTKEKEKSEWLVRAVRIGPLAYFENTQQEENVIRFFASLAEVKLKG